MSENEVREISEYLEFKYIIARDIDKNDKLSKQDRYIQKLFDNYLKIILENKVYLKNKEKAERLYCRSNSEDALAIIEILNEV